MKRPYRSSWVIAIAAAFLVETGRDDATTTELFTDGFETGNTDAWR